MKQTNRSRAFTPHPLFSGPAALSVALACILIAVALASCNTTVGVGAHTGTTRVGGSVGSSGSVVGIGTAVGPMVIAYQDQVFNGPSEARINHRDGIQAMQDGDYDTAAAIFEKTLETIPDHPDAVFYLGLTRIYQGRREEGFELLKSFHDPNYFRMTNSVQRMAEFMEPRTEVPAETVHDTMLRYRIDGYNNDLRETRDTRNLD